ncbi:MAG: helix-turn-helix transcriptional regulator [Oscillospiraceae bacterium]|nr:helix-turn-helix transcriptional regulator [Oscillospiraceae bacterium]
MDITICENLKKYRKDKGNTQEDLAEYLGISIQAISKWERNEGFPDITLLPKIAAYYNVSVDDLLGVGRIRRREKIDEYGKRAFRYANVGDTENILKVWREALQEFPNDLSVINGYMYALPDDNEKDANEKIKLAERLINESTDEENYTTGAIQNLCYTYMKLGDIETAKKYANTLPNYMVTQNQIMMSLLKGEEAVKQIQYNLMMMTDEIYLNAINMAHEGNYKPSEKIRIYEYSLKLFELLFEGDYGFYYDRTYDLYYKIADKYAQMRDLENTIKNLALSAEHAIKTITTPDGAYSSIFTNRQDHKKEDISTNSMDNSAKWLLKDMQEEMFDFCRDDDRFKAIAENLQKYAN